jgi:hypothetical protein
MAIRAVLAVTWYECVTLAFVPVFCHVYRRLSVVFRTLVAWNIKSSVEFRISGSNRGLVALSPYHGTTEYLCPNYRIHEADR